MTYREFLNFMAKQHNISKSDARLMFNTVLSSIREALLSGESVQFTGMYTVFPRLRKRNFSWTNPHTKVVMKLVDRMKLELRPAVRFQKLLTERFIGNNED